MKFSTYRDNLPRRRRASRRAVRLDSLKGLDLLDCGGWAGSGRTVTFSRRAGLKLLVLEADGGYSLIGMRMAFYFKMQLIAENDNDR